VRTIVIVAVFATGFGAGVWAAGRAGQSGSLPAERVTGIGGVFFKARDPKALGAWYQQKLGVGLKEGQPFALFQWRDQEDTTRLGTTVWSLFPATTRHFAPSEAPFMINYRVRNLDAMLAQLRALGVSVDTKVVEDFNGKFAWVVDPEGNKIELWEPKPGY
jgi:catechol 2,3-dioxygenase-like lactoylglutathione lyase family enzyme